MSKLIVTGPGSWVDPLTGADGLSKRRSLKSLSIPARIKRELGITDGQLFHISCTLGKSTLSFEARTTSGGELALPKSVALRLGARKRGEPLRITIAAGAAEQFMSLRDAFRRSLAPGGPLDKWLRAHPEYSANRDKAGHVMVERAGTCVTLYEGDEEFAFLTTERDAGKVNGTPSFRLKRGAPVQGRARQVDGNWFITIRPQNDTPFEVGPLNSMEFFETILSKAFRMARTADTLPHAALVKQIGEWSPPEGGDDREFQLALIHRRQGQPKFRKSLLEAYAQKCAISGCSVKELLEAAHVRPYSGPATNAVANGILLRGDLHTLFDLELLTIDHRSLTITIDKSVKDSEYQQFSGKILRLPASVSPKSFRLALSARRKVLSKARSRPRMS